MSQGLRRVSYLAGFGSPRPRVEIRNLLVPHLGEVRYTINDTNESVLSRLKAQRARGGGSDVGQEAGSRGYNALKLVGKCCVRARRSSGGET